MRAIVLIAVLLISNQVNAQLFRRNAYTQRYVPQRSYQCEVPGSVRPRPVTQLQTRPQQTVKSAVLVPTPMERQELSPNLGNTNTHGVSEQAKFEILRRGNLVEEIGGGHQASPLSIFAQVIAAVPQDDSGKWYISVITTKNCRYCEALLYDFGNNDHLKAFVNTQDFTKSWAHFNIFSAEDKTQAWRWSKIKVEGYPTILVQPPFNKSYGNPAAIVMQETGYDGDAEGLAETIRNAIKYYIEKQAYPAVEGGFEQAVAKPFTPVPPVADPVIQQSATAANIGVDPPFTVPERPTIPSGPLRPQIEPARPLIPRPDLNPTPDANPDSQVTELFAIRKAIQTIMGIFAVLMFIVSILTGGSLTNLLLITILIVLLSWRKWARTRVIQAQLDISNLKQEAGQVTTPLLLPPTQQSQQVVVQREVAKPITKARVEIIRSK